MHQVFSYTIYVIPQRDPHQGTPIKQHCFTHNRLLYGIDFCFECGLLPRYCVPGLLPRYCVPGLHFTSLQELSAFCYLVPHLSNMQNTLTVCAQVCCVACSVFDWCSLMVIPLWIETRRNFLCCGVTWTSDEQLSTFCLLTFEFIFVNASNEECKCLVFSYLCTLLIYCIHYTLSRTSHIKYKNTNLTIL